MKLPIFLGSSLLPAYLSDFLGSEIRGPSKAKVHLQTRGKVLIILHERMQMLQGGKSKEATSRASQTESRLCKDRPDYVCDYVPKDLECIPCFNL